MTIKISLIKKIKSYIFFFLSNENITVKRSYLPLFIFLTYFFITLLINFYTQKNWLFAGEMWAESATNYFEIANSNLGIVSKLIATDFGYIQFIPRLIAWIGFQIDFDYKFIPYLYNLAAPLISTFMVGIFCLNDFRKIIRSDFLRFVISIFIINSLEWETKTFINFSYIFTFYILIVCSLEVVASKKRNFAIIFPLLILSKPAVLSTIPIIFITSLFGSKKFRLISVISILLGIFQIISLYGNIDNFGNKNDISIFLKILATGGYFFGLIGNYFIGPEFFQNKYFSFSFGIIIFFTSLFLIYRYKKNSNILIAYSYLIIFSSILINSFGLSNKFNINMGYLSDYIINRPLTISFLFSILVFFSLINIFEENYKKKYLILIGLIWLVMNGTINYIFQHSKEPNIPRTKVSNWKKESNKINNGDYCILLNPFGWIYSKKCSIKNICVTSNEIQCGRSWSNPKFVKIEKNKTKYLKIPKSILKKDINKVIIILDANKEINVTLKLYNINDINFKPIDEIKLTTSIDKNNKIAEFNIGRNILINENTRSEIKADSDLALAYFKNNGEKVPGILWIGKAN